MFSDRPPRASHRWRVCSVFLSQLAIGRARAPQERLLKTGRTADRLTRFILSKSISPRGPPNRRSLGYAPTARRGRRDDKRGAAFTSATATERRTKPPLPANLLLGFAKTVMGFAR